MDPPLGSASLSTTTGREPSSSASSGLSLSDFPTLASRWGEPSTPSDSTSRNMLAPPNMSFKPQEEFVIQKEDFPALSPFGVSNTNDALLQGNSTGQTASAIGTRLGPDSHRTAEMAQVQAAFPALSVSSGQSAAATAAPHRTQAEPASSQKSEDRNALYGLEGLVNVVQMTDKDLNMLALGMDLTSLGLNLNSSEPLHLTFASPWSEKPAPKAPQYKLPLCFYMQPPSLKANNLSAFHDQTLFYIFYAMPMDVLQACAAQELYSRDWKYHTELKLWFQRGTQSDGIGSASPSSSQFFYFDVNSWERRVFKGSLHGGVHNVFLSEDDVRVKFATSSS